MVYTIYMINMQKRLVRPKQGRMLAGVCAAIANYFTIDVTIVRILWIILALPGGLPGVIPYIVLAVVIPSE